MNASALSMAKNMLGQTGQVRAKLRYNLVLVNAEKKDG
jgi:hypothetical protein